ncbi:MAG: undecaprenyl-diphosphate phosphatase [Burkholderiaceae bacterium]|nr:undecaprenyl-diphosphate phosphatase [Burkholderiaceae bacterium]
MDDMLAALRALPDEVKALLMGVVEGLTEFLPVSSTGHLILFGALLGFDDERAKTFDIAIQTGAVLSILWLYRARFIQALGQGYKSALLLHLAVAFMPSAVLGLLIGGAVKAHLFSPVPVAIALVVGGFVILWAEQRQSRHPEGVRIQTVDDVRVSDAFKIGMAQALALIPGTSRSGATIIGGMLFGFSRKAATEFSFFLAVPTIFAAAGYSLFKIRAALSWDQLPIFFIGTAAAFVTAMVVVRWLVRFVSNHSFRGFAYYRIVFGAMVIFLWQMGLLEWDGA